jgi:hypothetical protein
MIQTFQNKALENLFRENFNKGVPANLEKKIGSIHFWKIYHLWENVKGNNPVRCLRRA